MPLIFDTLATMSTTLPGMSLRSCASVIIVVSRTSHSSPAATPEASTPRSASVRATPHACACAACTTSGGKELGAQVHRLPTLAHWPPLPAMQSRSGNVPIARPPEHAAGRTHQHRLASPQETALEHGARNAERLLHVRLPEDGVQPLRDNARRQLRIFQTKVAPPRACIDAED